MPDLRDIHIRVRLEIGHLRVGMDAGLCTAAAA